MCERQYLMEDDQARRIQPTWPKTIFLHNPRGAEASPSTCCTISGRVLQEGVGRREMVWTGTAMMIRSIENNRENTETLLIF